MSASSANTCPPPKAAAYSASATDATTTGMRSPLSQSTQFVPFLFDYSLEIGGGFGGANNRKEALKGDQELDKLLFIRKCPLLAMWPAGS